MDCKNVKKRFCSSVFRFSPFVRPTNSLQSAFISDSSSGTPYRDSGNDTKGCYRACRSSDFGVLQSGVCGSKVFRGLEACDRPISPKQVFESPILFNGDCRVYQDGDAVGRMGGVSGSEGRLLSCSHPASTPSFSAVCLSRSGMAVPGSSVWSGPSTVDLHNGGERGPSDCTSKGMVSTPISGRLAFETSVSGDSDTPSQCPVRSLQSTGSGGELQEVRAHPISGLHLCGLSLPDPSGTGSTIRGKDPQIDLAGEMVLEGQDTSSSGLVISSGIDVFHRKACSHGPSPYETTTAGPEISVVSGCRSARNVSVSVSYVCQGPRMVARQVKCASGFPISPSPSFYSSVYGCLQGRLGSSLGFQDSLRTMGRRSPVLAHKCSGTPGGTPSFGTLEFSISGPGGAVGYGQFDRGLVYKQAGRDQVSNFANFCEGSPSLVRVPMYNSSGSAHPREAECVSGLSISERANTPYRVVSVPCGVQGRLPSLADAMGGSVCNQVELQAKSVCVPNPRPISLASRCPINVLGGSLCICVSANSSHSPSLKHDPVVSVSDHPGCSTVAGQELVSGPARLVSGFSQGTPKRTSLTEATQVVSVPQVSGESQTSRMLVVQRSLRERGFSEEVSSRIACPNRSSTLAVYQSKWAIFCAWCCSRKIDPLQATSPVIADFLTEKFQSGLAPSTVCGYRTAIAKTLIHLTGRDLGSDRDLSSLLHSFELERPTLRNPVPNWDLSLVLNVLLKDPFEPLQKAHLKLLTYKTVFLLALASGKRRSEIHALSFASLAWSADGLTAFFKVVPSFLAKTQLASAPPLAFSIASLDKVLGQGMEEDRLLCPIRALKVYLDRTKGLRRNTSLLFVSFRPNFSKDIRAATISSWIKKVILMAYDISKAVPPGPLKARAHDVRALAASLAYNAKTPLERVLEACTWSCHNTFTSFYLRDLSLHHEDIIRLGPMIVANAVP